MPILALLIATLLQASAVKLGEPAPDAILKMAEPYPASALPGDARPAEPVRTASVVLPGTAQPLTLLIDKANIVRRIQRGQALTGSSLETFVRQWQEGKSVFEASCARCHGEDGALHLCEDVKPLTGIGSRLSPGEIRKRLRIAEVNDREVVIRATFFKRHEVDALIAYIAGL